MMTKVNNDLLDDLKWMGIDVVSVANNHTTDYGVPGVLATLDHLKRAGDNIARHRSF